MLDPDTIKTTCMAQRALLKRTDDRAVKGSALETQHVYARQVQDDLVPDDCGQPELMDTNSTALARNQRHPSGERRPAAEGSIKSQAVVTTPCYIT